MANLLTKDLYRLWLEAKAKKPDLTVNSFAKRLGVTRDRLRGAVDRGNAGLYDEKFDARLADVQKVIDGFVPLPVQPPVERREKELQDARYRREHQELIDEVREARAREKFYSGLPPSVETKILRREKRSGLREATAVAVASDWHVEENVTRLQTGGLNEYNLDVAFERVSRFFAGVAWMNKLYRPEFQIRDLVLASLGDFVTGYLREENLEENHLSPIEASFWFHQHYAAGIRQLLEDDQLEQIVIPFVPGNHGRTTTKTRPSTYAKNSYEWLTFQHLAREFESEPRVKFMVDQSIHKWFEVYDYVVHVGHGDDVKYFGGVGGLAIPLGKRVPMWDRVRKADYHLCGHFHEFKDFGNVVVNGSLIGYAAYALSIGAAPEPAQQAYFLIDSRRGKTCVSPLWVEKREEED